MRSAPSPGPQNALIERVPDAAALLLLQYRDASGLGRRPEGSGSLRRRAQQVRH